MTHVHRLFISVIAITCFSCTSFRDNVKQNKEKFIQVGEENSQPVDISNLDAIYQSAQANDTEAKTRYLNVDKLETRYTDSFVLFINDDDVGVYDFASSPRGINTIEQQLGLVKVERVDKRLFVGRRKNN